jgi:hypothetical protein
MLQSSKPLSQPFGGGLLLITPELFDDEPV